MLKSPFILSLLAGFMMVAFTSCNEEEVVETPNSQKTVAEIAADDSQFSTLVSALERVDLVGVLNGNGPFTVFAPTNAAFDALSVDLSTLSDEALTEILLYHVFGAQVNAGDIAEGQTYLGMAAATGPGGTNLSLLVDNTAGKVTINGDVNVTATDIIGNNGVIHVVDKVITPLNVVGHAAANANFTELVSALGAATGDLVNVLSGDGPFTVFAPLNSAFEAISSTVAGLSAEQLSKVLTYHVASGNVRSTDLSDGIQVTSVNGETFTINLGDNVTITDAQGNTSTILLTDVQATNGVIHVIESVILPTNL